MANLMTALFESWEFLSHEDMKVVIPGQGAFFLLRRMIKAFICQRRLGYREYQSLTIFLSKWCEVSQNKPLCIYMYTERQKKLTCITSSGRCSLISTLSH